VVLTALVVFDHAAITYGAAGGWYLHEAPSASNLGLILLVTANQAFFMGFFFLIAGYFTPASHDRKGPLRFAADVGSAIRHSRYRVVLRRRRLRWRYATCRPGRRAGAAPRRPVHRRRVLPPAR
jgi:hypothetical protein